MSGPHTVGSILAKFRNCGCSDPRRPLAQEIVRLMTENDELRLRLAYVTTPIDAEQSVSPI